MFLALSFWLLGSQSETVYSHSAKKFELLGTRGLLANWLRLTAMATSHMWIETVLNVVDRTT